MFKAYIADTKVGRNLIMQVGLCVEILSDCNIY